MAPTAICASSRVPADETPDAALRTQVALTELERARVRKTVGTFVEGRRPPHHLRQQVDLAFRLTAQSVEIFEVRQAYGGDPGERIELPVAKATYVRTVRRWRVFWLRQDMKWHSYKPAPDVATIEEFVALVREDRNSCFFG
jgi:hypothetical protein